MADRYGSDFISISDEDGTEFELEVLSTVQYNGYSYLAVIPASDNENDPQYGVSILRSEDDNGEPILSILEDEQELKAVYDLIMDQLYEDEKD